MPCRPRSCPESASMVTAGTGLVASRLEPATGCSEVRLPFPGRTLSRTDWSGPIWGCRCRNTCTTAATTGSASTPTILKQQTLWITSGCTQRCEPIASMGMSSPKKTLTCDLTVGQGNAGSVPVTRLRNSGQSYRRTNDEGVTRSIVKDAGSEKPGNYDPVTHLATATVVGVVGDYIS